MRSFTTAWALGLIFITQSLQAQVTVGNFPPLEQVYKQLDEQLKNPCKDCYMQLAKKQDGYYVEIIPYNDPKYDHVEYLKIWDAATNKYLPVNLTKYVDLKNTNSSYKGHEGIRQQETLSDFNYFYGYPDYTKDLIAYLEKKTDLKPNELEMLARAYSAEAINFIHPNYSGNIISETKNLSEPGYEKVSEERIKSFRELSEKSISCYKKIKALRVMYQPVIIKQLDLKMNNDLMDYYLAMKSVKEPEMAKTYFDSIHYSAQEILAAKNILNNCKNAAILFVSGDNTTFPLLYVQDKYNFRSDVSVINSSLLQTNWYFDYIKQTYKIFTSLSVENYKLLTKVPVAVTNSGTAFTEFQKWLFNLNSELKSEKNLKNPYAGPQVTDKITLVRNSKEITITLNSNATLQASDIAILDFLASNPKNPVYVDHPAIFHANNLTEKLAIRGTLYEFIENIGTPYCDSESQAMLKQSIKSSKLTYSHKTGSVENLLFQGWCTSLNFMWNADTTGLKQIYADLKSKMDSKSLLKANDESLVIQYKTVMENMSPNDLAALYKLYSPFITKRLARLSDTELLTNKNMEMLSFLQKLYYPKIDPSNGKYTFTQEQKNTLIELQNKVKALMANPQNQKELSWTYDELLSVNAQLNALKLN